MSVVVIVQWSGLRDVSENLSNLRWQLNRTPTTLKTSDLSTHATSHVVYTRHYLIKATRSSTVLSRRPPVRYIIITSSANKSGIYIYIQIMGSCWGLEFQFLCYNALWYPFVLRSTFPTHHQLGIQAVINLVSSFGWNTVHQQHSSRSSIRSIHKRYLPRFLDGVSNSGSV